MSSNSDDQSWYQPPPPEAGCCTFSNDCKIAKVHILPCPIASHEVARANFLSSSWQTISEAQRNLSKRECDTRRMEADQKQQKGLLRTWLGQMQDREERLKQREADNDRRAAEVLERTQKNDTTARQLLEQQRNLQATRHRLCMRLATITEKVRHDARANAVERERLESRERVVGQREEYIDHLERESTAWYRGVRSAWRWNARDLREMHDQTAARNHTFYQAEMAAMAAQLDQYANGGADDNEYESVRNGPVTLQPLSDNVAHPNTHISFEERDFGEDIRRPREHSPMARQPSPFPTRAQLDALPIEEEEHVSQTESEDADDEGSDSDESTVVAPDEDEDKGSANEVSEDSTSNVATLTNGDDDNKNDDHLNHIVATPDDYHFVAGRVVRGVLVMAAGLVAGLGAFGGNFSR